MVGNKSILGYASLAFIFFFLIFSDAAAHSALNGMTLCAKVLIPTLFPTMVLTGIAVRSGALSTLSKIGSKLFPRLFGIDGRYIISFLIGLLGSAPTGAMAVKNLSDGEDKCNAASALLLSSTVSFSFIYTVVGKGMLYSGRRGIALFVFQIISVALMAMIMRPKNRKHRKTTMTEEKTENFPTTVASSIRDASAGMINVCGSVIFFSAVSGIFISLPISENVKLFICPFLELSSGLNYVAGKFPPDIAFVLASGAVGWSGLAMIFQSVSFAENEIPAHKYILGRAVSLILCPILAFISIHLGII